MVEKNYSHEMNEVPILYITRTEQEMNPTRQETNQIFFAKNAFDVAEGNKLSP